MRLEGIRVLLSRLPLNHGVILNGRSSDDIPGDDLGRIQDLLDWLLGHLRRGHCWPENGVSCTALVFPVRADVSLILHDGRDGWSAAACLRLGGGFSGCRSGTKVWMFAARINF